MNQRCPFCHQDVPTHLWHAHIAEHTKLREDGQMTAHVTLAPEQRYEGDLQNEPRWYRHETCGAITGMPEEIIRSYLVDPFLYSDSTFCTGCGKYLHMSQFHWVETGENLLAYNRRLRIEHIQKNHLDPNDFVWRDGAPVRRKRKVSKVVIAAGALVAVVVMLGLFIVGAAGIAGMMRQASRPQSPTSMPTPTFTTGPGSFGQPHRPAPGMNHSSPHGIAPPSSPSFTIGPGSEPTFPTREHR